MFIRSDHLPHAIFWQKSWGLFAVSGLLVLVLVDPGLIGPNPFPSSSVVRFFPAYLLIALVGIRTQRV